MKNKSKKMANHHPKPRKEKFAGADDIYLTKNKIAVKRVQSARTPTGYILQEKTKYYVRNNSNISELKKVTGGIVRRGRRGNNYERL